MHRVNTLLILTMCLMLNNALEYKYYKFNNVRNLQINKNKN